ncbi:MAG: putative Na+/H+ antiporter, partial [Candidatus Caldatribacteriota bacterium]
PAGYGILKDSFGGDGFNPLGLLKGALFPTFIAILCFLNLP